ncbi:MAG TPA: Hsp20/alpha crystallin family protein [Gaiellaceae bacterium]|nr:Hsp20/alpha crystallin family protein [Gaiellaceae bacterium]
MRKRDDIDRLHDEIRELVGDLWHVPRYVRPRHGFRPNVDCVRSDDPPALHVIVELPGVDPALLKVIAADRVLVVAGVRHRPPIEGRYQQMELECGPFERRISLAEPVDTSKASANYDRGLLTVVLPVATRAPKPQRQRVLIAIGGPR